MARNISKKQAGVIYGAWKRGNIESTKETMNLVYSFTEYFVTTDANTDNLVYILRKCIDALFSKDYEEAQDCINLFTATYNRCYVAA